MKSSHQTARSYVEAELRKRGYKVSSLAAGPLNVESPSGKKFKVQVIGLKSHNYWIIPKQTPQSDLYYVLTFVYHNESPKYNIWTSSDLMGQVEKEQQTYSEKTGREVAEGPFSSGIEFSSAFKGIDKWKRLPR